MNQKPKFKSLLSSITSTAAYAKGLQILEQDFTFLRLHKLKRITFEDITTEMSKNLSKSGIELTQCIDCDKIHVPCITCANRMKGENDLRINDR
jgi:hypothetical protein